MMSTIQNIWQEITSRLLAERWTHREGSRERREVRTSPPAFQHKEAEVQDNQLELGC